MTTHQLRSAVPAGGPRSPADRASKAVKTVGVAAALVVALGGMSAVAAGHPNHRGAAAHTRLAPPAASALRRSGLSATKVRGGQGARAVGEAIRQGGDGYWATYPDGAVIADSPAPVLGDEAGQHLSKPVVGLAETTDGNGYWLVAADGGVFNFGDAGFYGSTGGMRLNEPVVGIASTPDGHGYWLVASDGGVFNFGDAGFYGSTGGMRLNEPVVGIASTPDGHGYWLVASDGGIFNFGDAAFYGSTGSEKLNQPVVGMASTGDGAGYWLVAADGGVFTFGDAPFQGSAADSYPQAGEHAIGIAPAGGGGYWIENDAGGVTSMDAPVVASSAPSVQGGSPMPVSQDPSQSQPPSQDFYSNCFGSSYSASACDQSALSNIDNALASEGYGPLSLPSNYSSLSMAAQLIAVANAERTVRGLPAMPENGSLDYRAYQGAQASSDPTGPSGYAWGSNLAEGYPTALSADYVWMYDDGPNSPNVDCQSAGASGCWGHRHNILIQGGGQAGAALYDNNGSPNLTQLFVVNY
jgi:hypothetical protein